MSDQQHTDIPTQRQLQDLLSTFSTGNLVLDAFLRQLFVSVCSVATGFVIHYLKQHGIADETLIKSVPTVVFALGGTLVTLATIWWGTRVKKQTVDVAVKGAAMAAASGAVPDAIKQMATTRSQVAAIAAVIPPIPGGVKGGE